MNPRTTSTESPTTPTVTDPASQPGVSRTERSRHALTRNPATSTMPIIISR